jgi:hypothetical protein
VNCACPPFRRERAESLVRISKLLLPLVVAKPAKVDPVPLFAHAAAVSTLRTGSNFPGELSYAAILVSPGALPKARNAAIRFSVEGCVENNLNIAVPENGCMMYM